MIVEQNEVAETLKGSLALTLYLMGKSKYEIRQALIVLDDLLQDNYKLDDMAKYYQNLEFKVNDGKVKESSQKELSDDVLKEID